MNVTSAQMPFTKACLMTNAWVTGRHAPSWGCKTWQRMFNPIAGREQVTGSSNPITHRTSSSLLVFSCPTKAEWSMSNQGFLGECLCYRPVNNWKEKRTSIYWTLKVSRRDTKSHNYPMNKCFYPFCKWGKWGSERYSDLPKEKEEEWMYLRNERTSIFKLGFPRSRHWNKDMSTNGVFERLSQEALVEDWRKLK